MGTTTVDNCRVPVQLLCFAIAHSGVSVRFYNVVTDE